MIPIKDNMNWFIIWNCWLITDGQENDSILKDILRKTCKQRIDSWLSLAIHLYRQVVSAVLMNIKKNW